LLANSNVSSVWIDHVTFSLIGRQFLVSGYKQAGRVTISNCDMNGQTSWSSSCNNDHYWTMLFLGANDQITLKNNFIRNTSGRSPKVGTNGKITLHAVNNYWLNTGGHAFEVKQGGSVLMEGNVFENVVTPITAETANHGGVVFNVPNAAAAKTCAGYLGRACQTNNISRSGSFPSYTNANALAPYKGLKTIPMAMSSSSVAAYVKANAGFGKLRAARRRSIPA
jgi:pectin lyase